MATKPTQRAYTLRLKGNSKVTNWQEALWRTHEAVNNGARVFGDWLLTLRGGLDHTLADPPVPKKPRKGEQPDTAALQRNRRILLALSWLSVESADGAPSEYVVAKDSDPESDRQRKLLEEFKKILTDRGLKPAEIDSWVADCRESLCAAIRKDAVWVNRSKAFDAAAKRIPSLSRDEIWDLLSFFFEDKESYLSFNNSVETEGPTVKSEKTKDLVQKAGQWLSSRFGEGKGADFGRLAEVYNKIAKIAPNLPRGCSGRSAIALLAQKITGEESEAPLATLLELTGATGHKSATRNQLRNIDKMERVSPGDLDKLAELAANDADSAKSNIGRKGRRPYADAILADVERACGFTYLQEHGPARHWEFAVMLDHAARRVSVAHSWQKLAEARRQKLAADASRHTPPDVEEFLDRLLEARGRTTGAAGSVRIRPRAVQGWEELVRAWSGSGCTTAEDRINKVRELQDTLDKFGDATLFETLADDDAKLVWLRNGKPDPQPLLDYTRSRHAQERIRRYKVPAYRHPDPFIHPIFCDYGCSRWGISFAVHKAAQAVRSASENVDRLQKTYEAAEDEGARIKASMQLLRAKKNLEATHAEFKKKLADHSLSLGTWDGKEITATPLLWQSKRLTADLLPLQSPEGTSVSRGDRISRAAAGIGSDAAILVLNIFEEKDWNGRLQAPRDQLERLGKRVKKRDWDAQARKMRANLNWFLTFSARLMPQTQGPWPTYARKHQLNENPVYWPHNEENKSRKGLARLILCRLPHLRILSLDLGHRYAAACAVWETLPESEMKRIFVELGRRPPEPTDLSLRISKRDGKSIKTTIYRRTGPDMWARLDRQFLIKLQGEDRPSRKASAQEIGMVSDFEHAVGRTRSEDNPLPSGVVDLMSEAIRTARFALRRHGDRARIAFYLSTDRKPMPGGGWEELTHQTRRELILDALILWHSLFQNPQWQDERAEQMWNKYIRAKLPPFSDADASRAEQKAHNQKVRELLTEYAASLADNPPLRMKLHDEWATHWRQDDESWRIHLRWLRSWLLPRGKSKSEGSIRHVGGLSLDRLANIRGLWQVMKAYRTRPEPDDIRKNVPRKGDTQLEKYGQRILDTLESLRENRVKQLASRIIEAGLGIGSESPSHWEMRKRPRQPIPDPRFAPCQAIVVESLENYRPEQTRTRRENRQLMSWSAAKVLQYLKEGCELNGIHLRQVMPNYTSRQDSRTGAPGIRCTEIPVAEFLRRYRNSITKLREKNDACSRYLVALYDHWQSRTPTPADTVLLPDDGGELFVSADKDSPVAKGLQADLNAAANIGLRALLDPDWPGRWWWIPCDGKTGIPAKEKCKGSAAIDLNTPLDPDWKPVSQDIVNLWRDVSAESVKPGDWQSYSEYWNKVTDRVIRQLRKRGGLA